MDSDLASSEEEYFQVQQSNEGTQRNEVFEQSNDTAEEEVILMNVDGATQNDFIQFKYDNDIYRSKVYDDHCNNNDLYHDR